MTAGTASTATPPAFAVSNVSNVSVLFFLLIVGSIDLRFGIDVSTRCTQLAGLFL